MSSARRAVEHDLAAGAARARAQVDDAVGREHDLRVVLDDEQRVAGIAQLREHVDDAPEVARMQADARLVEHEQRVDERRAERRRQIDALHLAARQRARLPIEREVAQPDVAEIAQARADLAEHELGRVVERPRQLDALEELERALDGQHHEIVDRQARQRGERRVVERRQMRPETLRRARRPRPHRPASRAASRATSGFSRAPRASRARVVAAVLRQQHAHVHLVGLRSRATRRSARRHTTCAAATSLRRR